MSDLYGGNESEDMSSYLQILLHNSSSSAANNDSSVASAAAGGLFSGVGTTAESSSSLNFSDPNCFFPRESEVINHSGRVKYLGSSSEGHDACDAPANSSAPPRSSKRSRAAEVHNLSEKRRRSRINEKLKALQTLIPNSNKTDKASMLDEAIEYLKQLQLQVQMLTVRNGLSLHPGYSLGSLQSMLAPTSVLELDEGGSRLNANRGTETTLSRDQHNMFMHSELGTNNNVSSTLPTLVPTMANGSSGIIPGYMPSMHNHYGLLTHVGSKDICREDAGSRLQLDISCSGNNSSPGVSSSS